VASSTTAFAPINSFLYVFLLLGTALVVFDSCFLTLLPVLLQLLLSLSLLALLLMLAVALAIGFIFICYNGGCHCLLSGG